MKKEEELKCKDCGFKVRQYKSGLIRERHKSGCQNFKGWVIPTKKKSHIPHWIKDYWIGKGILEEKERTKLKVTALKCKIIDYANDELGGEVSEIPELNKVYEIIEEVFNEGLKERIK